MNEKFKYPEEFRPQRQELADSRAADNQRDTEWGNQDNCHQEKPLRRGEMERGETNKRAEK